MEGFGNQNYAAQAKGFMVGGIPGAVVNNYLEEKKAGNLPSNNPQQMAQLRQPIRYNTDKLPSGRELTYNPEANQAYDKQFRGASPTSGTRGAAYGLHNLTNPGSDQINELNLQQKGFDGGAGFFDAGAGSKPIDPVQQPQGQPQQSQNPPSGGYGNDDQTPQLPGDASQPAYFDNEYVKDNIDGLRSRMNIVPGMKLPQQQQAPQQQYNRPDYSYSPFNHGREKGDWVKSSTLDREAGLAKSQMSSDTSMRGQDISSGTTRRGQDIVGKNARNSLANTQSQQDFTNQLAQNRMDFDSGKVNSDPKYQYGQATANPGYMEQYAALLKTAGLDGKGTVDPTAFNKMAAEANAPSYETFQMLHDKYGNTQDQY